MEAKPAMEAEVETVLKAGQALVEDEPGTTAWLAAQMDPRGFGIFEVYSDDKGQQAHLSGKVAAALADEPYLFVDAPSTHQLDVLAESL